MTAGIREMLACRFGKESVVDVLEGTKLEQYSQKLGFGLYVVKGAVETSLQEVWANGCDRMFQAMAEQLGANSVKVKSAKNKYGYYRTVERGWWESAAASISTRVHRSILLFTQTRVATTGLAECWWTHSDGFMTSLG